MSTLKSKHLGGATRTAGKMGWMKSMFPVAGFLVIAASAQAGTVSGDIAVYNGSNTLLGYVSDVYDSQDSFTFGALSNALVVNIGTPVSAPFSMLESNPPGPNHYFGAVGGSGGYYLSSSSVGYTYLSGSALVAAGSTPSASATDINSLGYNGPEETTIWSVDGSNVITAGWVNTDNTTGSDTTFYDPVANYIGLTGNLASYNAFYGDGAYAVNLVFTGTLPSGSTPEPATGALVGIALAALAFARRRRA
jgi:hypothetical protein